MNNPTLLRTDEHGAILIGDTRITLDVIIAAFQNGDSPEQIHEGFPSLKLADINAVIAYYLNNRDEVEAYLRRRDEEAERIHDEIEAKRPDMFRLQKQLREKLIQAGILATDLGIPEDIAPIFDDELER